MKGWREPETAHMWANQKETSSLSLKKFWMIHDYLNTTLQWLLWWVQWLRLCSPSAGGPGLIPGQGTRSHMLKLRVELLCHIGDRRSQVLQLRSDISSVQSLSRVQLFVTPWIAARQASLSITNSRSSLKLMSIESVMTSSHLILCRPLLLLPPIPPSIRVYSNESNLLMRWPKYWSFGFSISPSNEQTPRTDLL